MDFVVWNSNIRETNKISFIKFIGDVVPLFCSRAVRSEIFFMTRVMNCDRSRTHGSQKRKPRVIILTAEVMVLVVQASPCLLCWEVFHYPLPYSNIFFTVFAINADENPQGLYETNEMIYLWKSVAEAGMLCAVRGNRSFPSHELRREARDRREPIYPRPCTCAAYPDPGWGPLLGC